MTNSSTGDQRHKLLILDGSKKSVEIIDQARRMGIHTVVTDYNTPTESPAKLAADEYFDVSTSDVDAVAALIHRESITGVLPGFSDRWLPTYADICVATGLPAYATADQLRLFTDKTRYKELLGRHGIPVVPDYTVDEARAGEIPTSAFPVVVKPSDGSGSRGISICADDAELKAGVEAALEYSWTGDLVIERYLPGEEATAHWLIRGGVPHLTMLANRHMMTVPGTTSRLPFAYSSPSYLLPAYTESIAPRVREMLEDAGIRNGMMFMQGLIHEGVFRTYDIGYRVTPTQDYRILEELNGYNSLKMLIDYALTGCMGDDVDARALTQGMSGYGFNISTIIRPGTISSFAGLEDVRAISGVLSVATSIVEGGVLPPEAAGQLRQIAVRTIGTAANKADLAAKMARISSKIDVVDDTGESMVIPSPELSELEEKVLDVRQGRDGQE